MGNNTISIKGNVVASQIQQGCKESSQENQNTFDISKCQHLIDTINKYRPLFDNEFGADSVKLQKALDSAQIAIDQGNPSTWKKAVSVIKEVLVGFSSSLLATGIMQLL